MTSGDPSLSPSGVNGFGDFEKWRETMADLRTRKGVVDLFFERRVERTWRLQGESVSSVETSFSEGGACRFEDGRLSSVDGLERTRLAGLIGVEARQLPTLSLPDPGVLPRWHELAIGEQTGLVTVRWLWRVAMVATVAGVTSVTRPLLADLTWADGRRTVRPWPLAPAWPLPAPPTAKPGQPPAGPVRALLSPQAAATLLHELLGHPLEGDLLVAGRSVWQGRLGERVLALPLDLWDDPTRWELPGAFSADDEGIAAAPRQLVDRGVLVAALAGHAHLGSLGGRAGNARRATPHTLPRPRVSNLVASCADASIEPPREEADLEVLAISSGTLEPRSGTVILLVRSAHTLRHGRPGRHLGAFSLFGHAHEVARGMIAAGSLPLPSAEPGWCGKEGELVPTGSEAPWLLVRGLEAR